MTRVRQIHDAAAVLFIRQGYAKTQISHIARAIGVSVGTIYHDFTSKEEIKNFIILSSINRDLLERELKTPVSGELFFNLEKQILKHFNRVSKDFGSHISDNAKDYSFETLISDSFDMLSEYGLLCLIIEKNPSDTGIVFDHYIEYRKNFFQAMRKYLAIFMEKKEIRSLEFPEHTATMIIEILSWWTMDVRYSSFEQQDIPQETAKKMCIDNIINAYGI